MDLLSLYKAVDNVGVNRVGIADTVGCASPRQVYDVRIPLETVRQIKAFFVPELWENFNMVNTNLIL